jgi:transcriptional regulator with XRE-family HTH domain
MSSGKTELIMYAVAIKARRETLGISQEELALRADVSPSLIAKIERGAHNPNNMTLKNLRNLLTALNWSPETWHQETGIGTLGVLPSKMPFKQFEPHIKLPMYKAVAKAVKLLEGFVQPDSYVEFDNIQMPKDANPNNLVLAIISNSDMHAEDASQNIPVGATIMLELWTTPKDGQIILLVATHKKFGNICFLRQFSADDVILRSYAKGGVVFSSADPDVESVRPVGVVRQWIVEAP